MREKWSWKKKERKICIRKNMVMKRKERKKEMIQHEEGNVEI